MDRASYCFHGPTDGGPKIDLIKLRDISDDRWNVDTLFLLPQDGKADELMQLAETWGADEIDWIEGREADNLLGVGGYNRRILRVWWD